ncbi:MAG TPA: protein kinase [Thermoanaerobaculia bacterium]|jgi:tRNA A-37 threonylcarbamoyl transferase component Bud32/tetratricopeptide (TPR) repeat protein|nr:protein kinase [Thermoanaerobaculia bacterium]
MDLSGKRLGHIRVERLLGGGGMGDVYEGFDEKLTRRVALKALHRGERLDEEARTRLIREARTLSQLDHPNICRIYDYIEGPDGDVLVLELIEGHTLQHAIEAGLTRADRLRIARDIAQVLVAAHRAGIIHRDLKPENVMLTGTGQVKVLDFGLARWIERASGPKRAPVRLASVRLRVEGPREEQWNAFAIDETLELDDLTGLPIDFDGPAAATAAGLTVGTPMFMSPEQARGEVLTAASDMYSFGLLLQAMFTARDPYPDTATGREIMIKAAQGQSLPLDGLEREVTALITSLKSLAPTDRPTAVDAAARLRAIMERPKRRARRAAVGLGVAVIALGAAKYTVDLRHERGLALAAQQRAVHAEGEAVRRRGQAEELVGFMVGDLRRKLEAVGRLDVLDAAATKALDYTAALQPEELSQNDLLRTSEALNQLGDVRIAQGRLDDAMGVFERSLKLSDAAVRRQPGDPASLLAAGTSHFWIGNAFRLRGDNDHALQHMLLYMNAGERLAAMYPDREQYQLERGYGHSTVAAILEAKGQLREALGHYVKTLELKQAHAEAAPDDPERRYDVSITLNHIGYVRERLGDLHLARNYYLGETAILTALCERDPKQRQWKQHLATNHNYIGSLAESMGDDEESLTQRQAERTIEQELHQLDPANADWARNLAITEMGIGDLLRRRGDTAGALASLDRSERLLRQLLLADPTRVAWQRTLGIVRLSRAHALLAAKQPAAALSVLNDVDRLLTDAAPYWLRFAAEAQLVRGDALLARGQPAAARSAWTRARTIVEPGARAATAEPPLLDIYARALVRLGDHASEPVLARLAAMDYAHRDLTISLRQ